MGRSKLEDHFRDTLQERELSPSHGAWEKLEQRLENEASEPGSSRFFWLALAASFAGVIFILGAIFYSGPSEDRLVQEEVQNLEEVSERPYRTITEVSESNPIADKTETQEEVERQEETVRKLEPVPQIQRRPMLQKQERNLANAEKVIAKVEERDSPVITPSAEEIFIQGKVAEVVAEIHHKKEVNDDEVEALLAKAQREITTYRILQSPSNKVDAAALLFDVEVELEQSFREKVFEILGEGFTKIRTAVAERNQ